MEDKIIEASTWHMEIEGGMQLVNENNMIRKDISMCSYLCASSVQILIFMQGIGVARFVLLLISIPLFRTSGAGSLRQRSYPVWSDDTI